jgi:chromosome segregation ATPase
MFCRPAADEGGMDTAVTQLVATPPPTQSAQFETEPASGLTAALGELEESTARVVSLRQKIERLGEQLAARQQALATLEQELAETRVSAEHDRATISRLEQELELRAGLLNRLRMELTSLAGELGMGGDAR